MSSRRKELYTMTRWTRCAWGIIFWVCLSAQASATTKWVDELSGSDVNTGTESAPYATIKKGVKAVCDGGGGTVYVMSDCYLSTTTTVYRPSDIKIAGYPEGTKRTIQYAGKRAFFVEAWGGFDVTFQDLAFEAATSVSSYELGKTIYSGGCLHLLNCDFSVGGGIPTASGAFVYSSHQNNIISNCTFNGDRGAQFAAGGNEVYNSRFVDCDANGDGGAINSVGALTVDGCAFERCGAVNGGAIYAGGALVARNTEFLTNHAERGGAVYAASTLFCQSVAGYENSSLWEGGFCYAHDSITATNLHLDGASGASADASGIYLSASLLGVSTIDNSQFLFMSNAVYVAGGGSRLTIKSTLFEDCMPVVHFEGGSAGYPLNMYNCCFQFAGNVDEMACWADYVGNIWHNTAYMDGGAGFIHIDGGCSGSIANSIIYWENIGGNGSAMPVQFSAGNGEANIPINYCNIYGGSDVPAGYAYSYVTTDQNPYIASADGRPTSSSPCLNAGNASYGLSIDIEGTARPLQGAYDQGCFERMAQAQIIGLSGDMAFGNVTVGQTLTRTLTIINSGSSSRMVWINDYPSGFSGNWSSGTIEAGGSRAVAVTFSPAAARDYRGTIQVVSYNLSDLIRDTSIISCSGTGSSAPASGTLQFDPSTYTANESDGTVTLTVTRTGGSPAQRA